MKQRPLRALLSIALVVILLLSMTKPAFILLDNRAYDITMKLLDRLGQGNRATGSVVMVALEESSSLAKKPLLFWYPDLGRFFRAIRGADAKAVGIDMIPTHSMAEKLHEAFSSIDPADNTFNHSDLEAIGESLDNALLRPLMELAETTPVVMATYHANVPFFHRQLPFLQNISAASAAITADPSDGVCRTQASSLETGKPYFAAALYAAATGKSPPPNGVRVDFTRTGSIPVVTFDAIVNGTADKRLLHDKIIILGFRSTVDRHPTPLSRQQYGQEIHAAALDSLLAEKPLTKAPAPLQLLALSLLALLGTLVGLWCRPSSAFPAALTASAVYFCAAAVSMANGTIYPVFPQIVAPVAALMIVYPYRTLFEERIRRKLYKIFNYYLDQRVIDDLVAGDLEHLLCGEKKQVTVMFIDIRNFTSLSQQVPAEAVIKLLNSFFSKVTEIIAANNGIVNKFIGDGVMAFFPLQETAGRDAIQASLSILGEGCDAARGTMTADAGFPESLRDFAVGIGLHHGEVIMGNVGSERKMDFTIMGSTVNLASRIEGLTKDFGSPVLLSETVHQMIQGFTSCRFMGEATVKGVAEPVKVYALSE